MEGTSFKKDNSADVLNPLSTLALLKDSVSDGAGVSLSRSFVIRAGSSADTWREADGRERKTDAVASSLGRSVLKEGPAAAATPCQGQAGRPCCFKRGGGAEFNGRMFPSRSVPQPDLCRLQDQKLNVPLAS